VDALLQQNRRPRARAEIAEQAIRWGEPVLSTAISEVRDGMLWLRGLSIEHCAEHFTLEDMAAHLWAVSAVDAPASGVASSLPSPLGRALEVLSREVPAAPELKPDAAAKRGGRLMSLVANALLGKSASGPIHLRLGQNWGLDASGCDDVRRALVLLSDHELNPSTFAVRIAASTGASLPAALLSGLATLSGPRHGGVATLARVALQATESGKMQAFLKDHADQSPYGYGFGHPLYPEGDPRARLILARLGATASPVAAVRALSSELGIPPNIDAALAALSLVHKLPDDAAFTIFATGRLIGWIAHAIEQQQTGEIIRPRARYRGSV